MASSIFQGLRDPQAAYNWEIDFYGTGTEGWNKLTSFQAKSTSIPMRTTDVIKKYYAGIRYAYPGQDTTPGILNVTFWDSEGLPAYEFFKDWYDLIQREDILNMRATPDEYLKTAIIKLFGRDGKTVASTTTFNSVFPVEIGEAPLVYADSSEFTFDVRFHYWYVRSEFNYPMGR